MRIIAERGVCVNIFPMVEARGKKFEGDYIIKRQGKPIFIGHENSRWDYNCYRVMDFVASKIREDFDNYCYQKFGEKNIPLSNFPQFFLISRPDMIDNVYRDDLNNIMKNERNIYSVEFNINFNDMMKSDCLKGLQPYIIKDTLQKINNFKFKTNYKIKTESNVKTTDGISLLDFSKGISNLNNNFTSFIKIKDSSYNLGVNNKKYNRKLNFCLGPMYGCSEFTVAFMHNIFTGGYNVIKNPKKFYSLSKYANILYRLRFFQFNNIKTVLKFTNVMNELGLSMNNITNSKKKFIQIIEDLADNKFIYIMDSGKDGNDIIYNVSTAKPKKKILIKSTFKGDSTKFNFNNEKSEQKSCEVKRRKFFKNLMIKKVTKIV